MSTKCQQVLILSGLFLATRLSGVAVGDDVVIGERTLVVAEGYEVSLAVPPALVQRPIAVARDERGRLYVTESGGMSERAEKQLELKPHRIQRLEDTDGDGVYDEATVFADRMMFPEGCMWFRGSLYVAAPPEIWKLTDDDDDGVADRREVWFDGKTLTGCGNDLHGPYCGPDGRLYWCKGAFAEQRHVLDDGSELVTQSSHIFRAKPDGSAMDNVLTGGMDNPVNVAFLRNGERFLSCTFFLYPEAGRRDGLIHAIYGGVYGKKHASIYAHPMTGDVMPVLNHQGAAAPCGLLAGSTALFGGGAESSLFACYFNLHKVVHHELVPNGPTYRTVDRDLLFCEHPDFHPTDVYEDADGSLLVVDTGGWYKVCCPTSQLAKPDVPGAVYRVRRKGQAAPANALGEDLNWDGVATVDLVERLSDKRLAVHRRATDQLRVRGLEAVDALRSRLKSASESEVRCRVVWTLAGIDGPESAAAAAEALQDPAEFVRHAAAHVAGLHRFQPAYAALVKMAASDAAGPARAASEALGRLKNPATVADMFRILASAPVQGVDAVGAPADEPSRILEHSRIFALIETGDAENTRDGLSSSAPQVVRAALVALDQMKNGQLRASDVLPAMAHPDRCVRATAAWIVTHHSDWGAELSDWFRPRLTQLHTTPPANVSQLRDLLTSLAGAPDIQTLIADQFDETASPECKKLALEVMAESGLSEAPERWLDCLASMCRSSDPELQGMAVRAAQRVPQPKDGHAELRAALLNAAESGALSTEVRLTAVDAAGPGNPLPEDVFTLLRESMQSDLPLELRSIGANRLASAKLSETQVNILADQLVHVGPMELPKLLPAFEALPSEALGMKLVESLRTSVGFRGLRIDLVQPLLAKYPTSVQEAGKSLLKMLNAGAEEQAAQLESLLKTLPEGDVRRGHEVFMSRKAACNTCHKLGYGGGRLGPDLTNIGRVRNRRDLVEALVFPSASLVRGYEPVSAVLLDGRVVSGIVTSEDQQELIIAQDAQKSVHLKRTDIESLHPSNVSPMPNGLVTLLSAQEMADLVAFLLSDQR